MIVKMKRYAFLVYHKEYHEFLETLREIGVVHIIEKAEGLPGDETLEKAMGLMNHVRSVTAMLQKRNKIQIEPQPGMDGYWILETVEKLQQEIENHKVQLTSTLKELNQLEPWGDFSWKLIGQLKEAGKFIHFFTVAKSKFQAKWEDEYLTFIINDHTSVLHFVAITDTIHPPEIEADLVKLPHHRLGKLLEIQSTLEKELQDYNHTIDEIASFGEEKLRPLQISANETIDLERVKLNTEAIAENRVMLLEGWVPDSKEEPLTDILQQSGILYEKNDPTVKDQVPILLKNNAFTKLFEMVGSLYSLPDYREIDLTPFFAPFFMLFFGFCLGDAGYGLLMMIATLILRAKAKPNMKPVWTLGFLFGVSTVIMGIIGGTFFGIMLVDLNVSWLTSLKKIMLDQNQLMYLSIGLGLLQIVFGMFLKAARAIKLFGLRHALSIIGWIVLILGLGGSFGLSALKWIDAGLANILMLITGLIGGILVLFFNSPGKNIFLNLGLGLWETYGTVTGLLGDVLSYIRLFALGLSSAVLGSVFNKLAFDLSGDTLIVSQIVTVLILLVGHTINFFMAALGSFVHPLRLTFVEFYKNTGFSGGGKKYIPYSKVVETK